MNAIQEIQPFRAWVANKYFHDLDDVEVNKHNRCSVFAICSYQGLQPTFMVRVMGIGAVFANIPVEALFTTRSISYVLRDCDQCHYNCPDNELQVNHYRYLEGDVLCYIGDETHSGNYYLTADWPFANQNMHLVGLKAGQFAWMANHKVLFRPDGEGGLPNYRKLTHEWRATSNHLSHRSQKKYPQG